MTASGGSYFDGSFDYRNLLPTRGENQDFGDSSGGSSGGGADVEENSCFPEMTWRERLLGCGTCMIGGYLLSLGSFWRIKDLIVHHDPLPFVVNATVGNLIALAGSCFLMGPRSQIQRMWHESRRVATALYMGSLVLTLIAALIKVPGQGLLLLFLMLCQYAAVFWYTLSYIPFAQDAVAGFVKRRWEAYSSR